MAGSRMERGWLRLSLRYDCASDSWPCRKLRFHHKASVVYYLIHYWYCVAPWSLLVAGIIVKALGRGAKRNAASALFPHSRAVDSGHAVMFQCQTAYIYAASRAVHDLLGCNVP